MASKTPYEPADINAVNAELEQLMAEEEQLKREVAEIIKNLEFREK